MAFDKDFLEFMTTQITVLPFKSVDGYGKQTMDTGISACAHIQQKSIIMRGNTMEDITLTGQIWMPPPGYNRTPTVGDNDHLILPDGEHKVWKVNTHYDEDGTPHNQHILYI